MIAILIVLTIAAILIFTQKGQAVVRAAGPQVAAIIGNQQVFTNPAKVRYPTPEEIANKIMPKVSTRPGFTQATKNDIIRSAKEGRIIFLPTACGTTPGATAAQLETQALRTGAVAAAPFTFGLSLFAMPFTGIFQHHAQAVKRENEVLCDVIPSSNTLMAKTINAVKNGQIGPQDGIQRLNELEAEAERALAPIKKEDSTHCNAACVTSRQLQAAIAARIIQLQRMQ